MKAMKSSSNSAGRPATKAKNGSSRTNGNASSRTHLNREQIAHLACQLYIESGCQEGQDAENWLRAEQILCEQAAGHTSARSRSGNKPQNGSKQRSYSEQS
jgi:hypothetical protein